MFSKNALLALALPLTISSAFAMVQVIPKTLQDIKKSGLKQKNYVLKSSKGTILEDGLKTIAPENWFNLSPAQGIEGVRTEEVYAKYGIAQSEDIIVAVIDSGVDVNHEDLQGKIWINEEEIANNNIDDDNNGYIDDVFGWNFIGGKNGMATIEKDADLGNGIRLVKGDPAAQVDGDTLEGTRELARLRALNEKFRLLGKKLPAHLESYLAELENVIGVKVKEAKEQHAKFTAALKKFTNSVKVLKDAGLEEVKLEVVRAFTPANQDQIDAKNHLLSMLTREIDEAYLQEGLAHFENALKFHFNMDADKDPRKVVGDNYDNQLEQYYGNNDVIGPDSGHGTHVSGSIAANRDNGLGIKGVATNVKIMAIRAVPNGDERDKDVANAIRYAVDNGARIINMSFGKSYSPYKEVVDQAVRYAEKKGVLLVHAAGNDNKDNDVKPSFPTRNDKEEAREFSNWLEICATSSKKGLSLPADFTNYGKKTVDFCAPGVDIYSTTPDNSYDSYSGTSMAAPTVSGVVALALSYDTGMDAVAVKSLLIDTSRRYPKLKVNLPGTETPVLFSTLSTFGTIVDAFEAVQMIKE